MDKPSPKEIPDNTAVRFGGAAGLIHSIEPAALIIERIGAEALAA